MMNFVKLFINITFKNKSEIVREFSRSYFCGKSHQKTKKCIDIVKKFPEILSVNFPIQLKVDRHHYRIVLEVFFEKFP